MTAFDICGACIGTEWISLHFRKAGQLIPPVRRQCALTIGCVSVVWLVAFQTDLRAQTSGTQPFNVASPVRLLDQPNDPIAFPAWQTTELNANTTWISNEANAGSSFVATESYDELEALRTRLEKLENARADDKKKDAKKAEEAKKKEDEKKAEAKKSWNVKFGGHVQMDWVEWANSTPNIPDPQNYFNFRRLRLTADGTGYENYDFRLQMSLEPDNSSDNPAGSVLTGQVKDAYFSVNEVPFFGRLRVGNFFVPFSLEQVTNDTFNVFLERSIPVQGIYSADREVGIAMYNCTEDQRVTWTSGVFIDSISEGAKKRIDDNQGCRVSGRLTWLPFYDEATKGRRLLHTGLGILYTKDQDRQVRLRARPQVSEGPRLIDSGILLANSYTTGNVEAALVWERLTVQSEAFLNTIDQLNGDSVTTNGAYVHTSYFLTGENRIFEKFGQHGAQFGRTKPNSVFSWTQSKFSPGAWELKARWSHLDFNNLNRGQYNDFTFGWNWYWSDRTRMMFDWIHPITSQTTTVGAGNGDLLACRFDFNW